MSETPHTLRLDKFVIQTKRRKNTLNCSNLNNLSKLKLVKSSLTVRPWSIKDSNCQDNQENVSLNEQIDHSSSTNNNYESNITNDSHICKKRESAKQWREAMRKMVRMPQGLPDQMRMRIWKNLADQYIEFSWLDWDHIKQISFNPTINPDDLILDQQIVKDLHRTGCEQLGSEVDRVTLKRVLLAYARWNKKVGYCQGLNIIAAIILEVTNKDAEIAFKILVFLVDSVLPDAFFARNLQALSVDMYIFRNLLHKLHPELTEHLDILKERSSLRIENQLNCGEEKVGKKSCYEPPLCNMYTMQWYLTLFATNLPRETVLHLWDAIMLEGSEVYIRCSLAIFMTIADDLLKVTSADMFYVEMSRIVGELAEGKIISRTELMRKIYSFGQFPMYGLKELREKYMYNVSPFISPFDIHDDDCILSDQQSVQINKKKKKKLFSMIKKKPKDLIELGFQTTNDTDEVFVVEENSGQYLNITTPTTSSIFNNIQKESFVDYDPNAETKSDSDYMKITGNWNQAYELDDNFIMKSIDESRQSIQNYDRKWKSMMLNEKQGEYREIFARRIVSVDLEIEQPSSSQSSLFSLNDDSKLLRDINTISPGPISEVRGKNSDNSASILSKKTDLNELRRNYKKSKSRRRNIHFDMTDLIDSVSNHEMDSSNHERILSEPIPLENQMKENLKLQKLAQKFQTERNYAEPVNHLLLGSHCSSNNSREIEVEISHDLNSDIMKEWNRRNENVYIKNFAGVYAVEYVGDDEAIELKREGSESNFSLTSTNLEEQQKEKEKPPPPWKEAISICVKQRPLKRKSGVQKMNSLAQTRKNGINSKFGIYN